MIDREAKREAKKSSSTIELITMATVLRMRGRERERERGTGCQKRTEQPENNCVWGKRETFSAARSAC